MLAQQSRPQLVLPQRGGGAEPRRDDLIQRLLAGHDVVEGVADRDDVVDLQLVAAVDEHLLHDFERRTLALHEPGERAQGRHQRRAEGVGQAERGLVGAAVPLVGVDAVQQHVPDVGAPVQRRERGGEHRGGPLVTRAEQPLVRHVREVLVAEHDRGEAALLVAEGPVERLLLRAGRSGVGEPARQVELPGDERHQRDRPRVLRLDESGELRGLLAEELPVLHAEGEPEHQLVEEQDDGVVPETLRMGRHGGEPAVEVDVAGL